jgi:hypothetical protein
MVKVVLFLTAVIIFFLPTKSANGNGNQWQSVVPGIDYREFYIQGPNHVFVTRMDRSNQNIVIDTSIAQGKISGGLEPVSQMVERYDQAINFWGEDWGRRNDVIAAVNGYFFDPESGIPWRGQVQSGWYAKRFDDLESGSGFTWKLDRSIFLGGCVVHRPAKQYIKNLSSGQEVRFDNVNTLQEDNDLILYTPQFDTAKYSDDNSTDVIIQVRQPTMILNSPEYNEGVVREVYIEEGSIPLLFDHVILSGSGSSGEMLGNIFQPGDMVAIFQEIKHFEQDCTNPDKNDWAGSYASTGGSYIMLKDGVVQKSDDLGAVLRNARTVLAYNDRYFYFVVVEDKESFGNLGMSIVELSFFVKNSIGAVWAIALDGGGSSTMYVNGEIKNKTAATETYSDDRGIERAVANGIMMVQIQPKQQSNKFSAGDQVYVSGADLLAIRTGPGVNYGIIGSIEQGFSGLILDHENRLNGIFAKGFYWWYVAFGEMSGWVAEDFLAPLN